MTSQLLIFGILGVVSTAVAFAWNRHLFTSAGRVSVLEGLFYLFGLISLGLGWYLDRKSVV